MGAKSFLLTGDLAIINLSLSNGQAVLTAPCNGLLKGSSSSSDNGRIICVKGDEKEILFIPVPYMVIPTPPNVPGTPGMVLCKVKELDSSHISTLATAQNKKILYIGSGKFTVEFQVVVPATEVTPVGVPIPDKSVTHSGTGIFKEISSHHVEEK